MLTPRQPSYVESNQHAPHSRVVVLCGGGSGGHITPLLAVAHILKQQDVKVVYIGEKGGRLFDIARNNQNIDVSYHIFAGKLRRYHGEGWRQLLDIPTSLRNIRDVFLTTLGFLQALWRLFCLKPGVIFIKGGFVGVPVGLAAAILRIPFITHDSDSVPGLANRLIAPWARANAVGMPSELYTYNKAKTYFTGIPVDNHFVPLNPGLIQQYRKQLHITDAEQIIFVTGGGLGATRLNQAVAVVAQEILSLFPKLYILHAVGRGNDVSAQKLYSSLPATLLERVIIKDFIPDLYVYSGAADIIITRASATALAEFAAQGKACVVVPNPLLTGGHQLKNAEYFIKQEAVLAVTEDQLQKDESALLPVLKGLLENHSKRFDLSVELGKLRQPEATNKIVELLLKNEKRYQ